MAYIAYPEELLPPPETAPFVRNLGTRETDIPRGPRTFGAVERAFRGTQDVTFLFSSTQAMAFRDWWLNTLLRGGAWFTTRWPLPSGWFSPLGLRKFTTVPRWRHIGGGAWRVSVSTELVAVRAQSTLKLTSWTYPLAVVEMLLSDLVVQDGPSIGYSERIESGVSILNGDLRTYVFHSYVVPPELIESGVSVLEGRLVAFVIHVYDIREDVTSSVALLSGVLKNALITYTIPPENIESGVSVLEGTLL